MKRIQQALELSRRQPVAGSQSLPPPIESLLPIESLTPPNELPPSQVETPSPQVEVLPPQIEPTLPVKPRTNKTRGIRRQRAPHVISQATVNRNRLKLGTESDATAEAYRVVRSRVLQWLDTNGRNSIAMVSAAPDEGKTLSAVNLAFSIAQDTNHTVLLVDFDLRSPSIHRTLELDVLRGLESYFANGAPLEELIVPVAFPRLAVLPCLQPIAGSSELLAGSVVRDLVAELRGRYADRVIVFDLPPALMGDDALVFLPLIDAALVVISDGTTRKDHLVQLGELLGDVPVIGSLLNRVKVHPMQAHYS